MKAYLAGSIFYYGDELRNKEWASKLRKAFPQMELYSPIENTEINGVEGKKKFADSKKIAEADNKRLDETDILIACLDGDIIPSGTCAEIGVMREKIRRGDHKYIVGICTDNRQMYLTHSLEKDAGGASELGEQQYSYQNLYVTGLVKESGELVSSIEEAIEFIKKVESEFDCVIQRATVEEETMEQLIEKMIEKYMTSWKESIIATDNNFWVYRPTLTQSDIDASLQDLRAITDVIDEYVGEAKNDL